jgi:N-glycosidase YbiA
MNSIRFYEGPFYLLSNFSAHKVVFEGVEYMTSEHAYQVAKFRDPVIRERIKSAPSAFLAREFGQAKEGMTEGWNEKKVFVMKEIMRAKMLQHEDVREALRSTGDAPIEKNHPDDSYWGTGADGSGENVMGKIWMELREELEKI